jgi:periplasmic protein CpxP/Spy
MNRKYFYLIIFCLLLFSNFILLYFVMQKPKGGFKPDGPKKIIVEKLQFDEEQIVLYQKLIDQHRNDIRKKDAEILMLKRELYYYLTTNESETSIDSLTTEIGITQKQIEKIHFNHFLDIKALCKPQQLLKFNMLSEELIEIFNHKKHLKPQTK